MEEDFEIEDNGGFKLLYCRKRKLEILVTERYDIPVYPDHFIMVFVTNKIPAEGKAIAKEFVVCFAAMDYNKIDYEPYFRHLLVTNAIHYYMMEEWHVKPGEITYSPAYKKTFMDTMSLDPKKMTPQLRGYMSRDPAEEALDFLTWKKKHWDTKVD